MSPKESPPQGPITSVQQRLYCSEMAVAVNCGYKGAIEVGGSCPHHLIEEVM